MRTDLLVQEPKAASWLVPTVLIPIVLIGSVVVYALYRFIHLGPAAFS